MSEHFDLVRRFAVDQQTVRGQYVRLGPAWLALREHADYPPIVRRLLGEASAAAVLLASTLKFEGELTVQMQGDGPLRLLVAQCTHDFRIRGVARFDRARLEALSSPDFGALLGAGQLVVTVEAAAAASRYQGVVPIDPTSLADSLGRYFEQSEQLPTAVALAADDAGAAGLLVQRLPQAGGHVSGVADESLAQQAFERARDTLASLAGDELLARPATELMQRSFAGLDLRLFEAQPVEFRCRCSEARVTDMLRSIGATEVQSILTEQGAVTVTCEFCHRPWRFDAVDVARLFGAPGSQAPSSGSLN